VLGLTCALRLQEEGFDISIFARDLSDDLYSQAFASPWAGANWSSFASNDDKRLQGWESYTFTMLRQLGLDIIMDCPGVTYYKDKSQFENIDWFKDFLPDFEEISPSECPAGTGYGVKFTTLTLSTPDYLAYLNRRVRDLGVTITRKIIHSIEQAYDLVPGTTLVVNATGLGAKSILGIEDPDVEPIRGQTVLIRAPNAKATISKLDDKANAVYIIPRPTGDVICGGCFQVGNWDLSPDYHLASRILENCYKLDSALSDGKGVDAIQIISHNVGLRPSRKGGAKLELEMVRLPLTNPLKPLSAKQESREVPVVHCYGIGPAGYQTSWGMAEDVLNLVKKQLGT